MIKNDYKWFNDNRSTQLGYLIVVPNMCLKATDWSQPGFSSKYEMPQLGSTRNLFGSAQLRKFQLELITMKNTMFANKSISWYWLYSFFYEKPKSCPPNFSLFDLVFCKQNDQNNFGHSDYKFQSRLGHNH